VSVRAQGAAYDAKLAEAYATAYDLDHEEAVRKFEALAKLAPDLPASYRALASIRWLRLLFTRGTVLADEYLGRLTRHDVDMAPPPADIADGFQRSLSTAVALAEARVAAAPRDARAHYDLASALGLQASWAATVEGRMGRAFSSARRAHHAAERAATLDPADPDPRLILGTYRYVVADLSLPARMVAYLAGMDGDRERGLRLLEDAAASGRPVQTEARFALVLLYNRERRWNDALRVLAQLRAAHPRNRLLWLESGATALRAGRAADALRWLDEGLAMAAADPRRRMFGEEALWRLKRALALRTLGRQDDARDALLAGLEAPEAREWVRGRLHLALGEISLASGDRAQARWQAAKALPLLERGADPEGARLARQLLERAGRG
jgi:hypothetical protein